MKQNYENTVRNKDGKILRFIRRHDIVKKLVFTAVYLTLVVCLYYLLGKCIFITLFDVPCPGCGMSRAMFAAFRLDFGSAFRYHMMFWSMPLLYIYFLLDGHIFGRRVDRAVLILILAGFVVNWIISPISHCF